MSVKHTRTRWKKNCSYKFNTPSYTSMYLYNSINTPRYTTSTTTTCIQQYRFHVPNWRDSPTWWRRPICSVVVPWYLRRGGGWLNPFPTLPHFLAIPLGGLTFALKNILKKEKKKKGPKKSKNIPISRSAVYIHCPLSIQDGTKIVQHKNNTHTCPSPLRPLSTW